MASCDLLKKCYLCSSNNNTARKRWWLNVVVICSKNVTFAVATTMGEMSASWQGCCDLLKKCYLCSSNNNELSYLIYIRSVVICSKNVTFAVATTIRMAITLFVDSCDLLKKCYLCSSNNNEWALLNRWPKVVICSKNVTFAVATTIYCHNYVFQCWLWFAQKMLPLQ